MKKPIPTVEQHKKFSASLRQCRTTLEGLATDLQHHYPKSVSMKPFELSKKIDLIRSGLDNMLAQESHGKYGICNCIYYPFQIEPELFEHFDDIPDFNDEDPSVSGRISVTKRGVTIDGHYFIEKSRIDSAAKLLTWVLHLLGNNWCNSPAFMEYFIDTVSRHYDLNVRDFSV